MILVGGENLVDFINQPNGNGALNFRAVAGGSPYNVAKTLARQNVKTGYLTPISSDPLGDMLVAGLPDQHLELLSPRSARPSSLAVVSLKDGQPVYQFYRENTAERDITAKSLAAALPKNPKGFYVGSLAIANGGDAKIWEQAWLDAAARGVFCAIDPNIRPDFIDDRAIYLARLNRMFAAADLIKLSDEDISWIAPELPPLVAAQQLFDHAKPALLVLTRGAKGAIAINAGNSVEIPAHPVPDLKDTVGAGDTFMGTLLAQILAQNLMTGTALRAASQNAISGLLKSAGKAAAINCGRSGCNPPLLSEL